MESPLPMSNLLPHLSLARQFAGFSVLGLVNTAIHLAVVVGLVEGVAVFPVVANGLAFVCANVFSFWGNSRWVFRARPTRQRYARFLLVSLLGLAVSLGASALGESRHWHYLAGVALSFALLPALTFFAHRIWTWKTL